MRLDKISKRTRNGITARLKATIDKYGHEETRIVCTRYFLQNKQRTKLKQQIDDLQKELKALRRKAR
jgi:hypothetical protein